MTDSLEDLLISNVLHLGDLQYADIAPDWQTIYQGWRGFPTDEGTLHLPTPTVQQFALDALSTSTSDTDSLFARIIDAGPSFRELSVEEIALQRLATQSGITATRAKRHWQLALTYTLARKLNTVPAAELEDEYGWRAYVSTTVKSIEQIAPGLTLPRDDTTAPAAYSGSLQEWLFWNTAALRSSAD